MGFLLELDLLIISNLIKLITNKRNIMSCGCGRSPTGECIGWHGLTEEEYQKKLKEYNAKSKS